MPNVTFISPEERAIRERDTSTRYVRDQHSKDVTFLLAQIDSMRSNALYAAAPAMLSALKAAYIELDYCDARVTVEDAIRDAEGR